MASDGNPLLSISPLFPDGARDQSLQNAACSADHIYKRSLAPAAAVLVSNFLKPNFTCANDTIVLQVKPVSAHQNSAHRRTL